MLYQKGNHNFHLNFSLLEIQLLEFLSLLTLLANFSKAVILLSESCWYSLFSARNVDLSCWIVSECLDLMTITSFSSSFILSNWSVCKSWKGKTVKYIRVPVYLLLVHIIDMQKIYQESCYTNKIELDIKILRIFHDWVSYFCDK